MKKLLLIALVVASIAAPTQGMERIKSWLGFAKKSNPPTEITNTQTCPICLDDLITNPPEQITQLPCHSQHIFHANCINLWKATQLAAQGHATCPYCKKSYARTIKANLIPSLGYTAAMLFATWEWGHLLNTMNANLAEINLIKNDYQHHPEWIKWENKFQFLAAANKAVQLGIKGVGIPGTNLIALTVNEHVVNHPWKTLSLRNLAITSAALFAGIKYMEHYPQLFNHDAPYLNRALAMAPLSVCYFMATRFLEYKQ